MARKTQRVREGKGRQGGLLLPASLDLEPLLYQVGGGSHMCVGGVEAGGDGRKLRVDRVRGCVGGGDAGQGECPNIHEEGQG